MYPAQIERVKDEGWLIQCPRSETLPVCGRPFFTAARRAIRALPTAVKRELGKAILDLQKGHDLGMPLSRPMPTVAAGMAELRIRDAAGIYRTFYFKKSARGVLIPHAFVKRTQKTSRTDIELARKRLKEMLYEEQVRHRE
jgi:phage-related protein